MMRRPKSKKFSKPRSQRLFRRLLVAERLEDRRVFATYDLGFLASNYIQDDSIANSFDQDTYYFGTLGNGGGGTGVLLEYSPSWGSLNLCISDPFGNNAVCANGNAFGQAFIALNNPPAAMAANVAGFPSTFLGTPYRITFGVPVPVQVDTFDAFIPNDIPSLASNLNGPSGNLVGSGFADGTIHFNTNQFAADVDWYSFSTAAVAGPTDYFGVEFFHTAGDIEIGLYTAAGALLASSTSSTNQEWIALSGLPQGNYFVKVYTASGQASPGYRMSWQMPEFSGDRMEPNNTPDSAFDLGLVVGELVEEGLSILPSGDEDWFRFEIGAGASEGHEVAIQFVNAFGDVDVALFDAAGNAVDFSFSTADEEILSLALLPAGEYYLAVFGFYGSTNGEYQLRINAPRPLVPDSTESLTGPVQLGTLSGETIKSGLSLHQVVDVDRFAFSLAQGATGLDGVTIVQPDSQPVSAILYDSSRRVVATYDQGQQRLRFSGLAADNYELVVFGVSGSVVPDYSLRFSTSSGAGSSDVFDAKRSNNSAATATDLGTIHGGRAYGSEQRLSIGTVNDEDWYKFSLAETARTGAGYRISFDHDSGRGDLDLTLYRANADGSLGARIASSAGTSNTEFISLEGLNAGSYLVQVKGYASKSTGPYQMDIFVPGPDALESPRNDTKATATNLDQVPAARNTSGQTRDISFEDLTLDSGADRDWFQFSLNTTDKAFEELSVAFVHSLGDIDIRLYSGNNANPIRSSTGTSNTETIDLKGLSAGSYYLEVYSYSQKENPGYRLSFKAPPSISQDPFEPNNSRPNAKDLGKVNGFGFWGEAERLPAITAGDEDWYKFEIASNGVSSSGVLLAMNYLAGDLDFELYDNTGSKLATSGEASNIEWISLQNRPAGAYWLRVYGKGQATSPGYALIINAPWIPAPDIYEPNNTVAAATQLGTLNTFQFVEHVSIDTESDLDQYWFRIDSVGKEGQFAAITFDGSVGNLGLKLYDSTGKLVEESLTSASVESVSLAGLAAGNYRLEVSGAINQYVMTLFGPASASGDSYEGPTGNNTQATAYDLRELRGVVAVEPLSLHQAGDIDWFKFTIPSGSTLAASDFVAIEHDAQLGDLDLELYNSAGVLLSYQGNPRSARTGQNFERVSLEGIASSDGTIFVKVFGHQGLANSSYKLLIQTAIDASRTDWAEPNNTNATAKDLQRVEGAKSWSNLSISNSSDKDWYRFSTVSGAKFEAGNSISVLFDVAQGDLNLRLYRSSDLNTPLRTSITDGSRETISLEGLNEADGPFYILVDGDSQPMYELQIDAPVGLVADWAEKHGTVTSNNVRSNAFDLRTPMGTLVLSDLSIDPTGDIDYYRFELTKAGAEGDEVLLQYRESLGTLNLKLENANGTVLREGQSKNNGLLLSLSGLAVGEYFLRVAGSTSNVTNPNYQLTLALPKLLSADVAEVNDTPATATDLNKLTISRNRSRSMYYNMDASELPGVLSSIQGPLQTLQQNLGWNTDFITSLFNPAGLPGFMPQHFNNDSEVTAAHQHVIDSLFNGPGSLVSGFLNGGMGSSALTSIANNLGVSTNTVPYPSLNMNNGYNLGANILGNYFGTNAYSTNMLQSLIPNVSLPYDSLFGGNGLNAGANLLNSYGYGYGSNAFNSLLPNLSVPYASLYGGNGLNAGANLLTDYFGGGYGLGQLASLLPGGFYRDIVTNRSDDQGMDAQRVVSGMSIHTTSDVDWYRIELESDAQSHDGISISGVDTGTTMVVELYPSGILSNSSLQSIGVSAASGSTSYLTLAGMTKGVYYVKVTASGKTQSSYSMTVSLQPTEKIAADWAEPNDSASTTRDLREIEGSRIVDGLSLHSSTDTDWFSFQTIAVGTDSDYVRIDGLDNSGDIDIKLYSNAGVELRKSESSSRSEQLSLSGLAAGSYKIQVTGYKGSTAALYSMLIVAPNQRVEPDGLEPNNSIGAATRISNDSLQSSINGLTLHANDSDVYRFQLTGAAGATHSVSISQALDAPKAIVEILNAAGTVVRTSSASGVGQLVSLQGLSGTVYARVRAVTVGAATDYSLHWDLPSSVGTELIDEWTIMVYMTAADLEISAMQDLNEMESALLPSNVNIVVFLDQSSGSVPDGNGGFRPARQIATGSNGLWGDSGVAMIRPDFNSSVVSTTFQRWGEKNSAAPDTLRQFIRWGQENAPARKYGLIMWDHGGGVEGANVDVESGRDFMTLPEVRSAIQDSGVTFSLIAYDACQMGTAELSYVLRDLTDVIVSSQENVEGAGYDYTTALASLMFRPDLATPFEVASGMINSFSAQYVGRSQSMSDTLVAINADGVDPLVNALAQFVNAAMSLPINSVDWTVMRDATLYTPSYGGREDALHRDIGGFMQYIATYASPAVRAAAINVLTALRTMVVSKTPDARQSQGQSIFLPIYYNSAGWINARSTYLRDISTFSTRTRWADFLDRLILPGTLLRLRQDPTGRNEIPNRAFPLRDVSGGTQTFTQLTSADGGSEWFRFSLAGSGVAGDEIRLGSLLTNARVFAATSGGTGAALRSMTGSGTNRKIDLSGLTAGEYLLQIEGVSDASKSYDFTFAIGAKSNSVDLSNRHDVPGKALDLGVIVTDRLLAGYQLTPSTDDWFEFQNPRLESPTNRVLRIVPAANSTAQLELFRIDAETGNAISLGTREGTGELAIEFAPGDGLRYRFVVRPRNVTQSKPYHVVIDSQGADRFSWTNSSNPLDVDEDKTVSPLDVLVMINDINQRGSRTLGRLLQRPDDYLDVDRDGSMSPLDILTVINYLNRGGNGEGESTHAMWESGDGSKMDPLNARSVDQLFSSDLQQIEAWQNDAWSQDWENIPLSRRSAAALRWWSNSRGGDSRRV